MRYFLKLAYNGFPFHGWQRQPNAISVQEVLENNLSLIIREEIKLTGAGRTDSGVNARIMYAHFDVSSPLDNIQSLIKSLNRLIGKNIAIYDIIKVEDSAHARFDAVKRTYKYFVSTVKNPFFYDLTLPSFNKLNIDKMNEASLILLETEDFTSFAKLHSDVKTNICKVTEANWKRFSEMRKPQNNDSLYDGLVFTISADRFLRNMVRAIVGTLLEVGKNKISLQDFKDIIDKKDRCVAGESVEPQGLFLWDITYPYLK